MPERGSLQMHISSPDLQRLMARFASAPGVLGTEMKKAMRDATNAVRREERARAPRGTTGKLASSVRTSVSTRGGTVVGKVYPKTRYAHIVEGGARAHIIRPHGQFLRIGGRYVRQVAHPGMRGRHFVQAALHAAKGAVEDAFEGAIERLVHHIVGRRGL